jgi:hypothetical protein
MLSTVVGASADLQNNYSEYEQYLYERWIYEQLQKSKAEVLNNPDYEFYDSDEVFAEIEQMLKAQGL